MMTYLIKCQLFSCMGGTFLGLFQKFQTNIFDFKNHKALLKVKKTMKDFKLVNEQFWTMGFLYVK